MNVNQPAYAVAYGLGFAAGTYLGMLIEERLAFGNQLVFLLTAKGPELTEVLRTADYKVAELKGRLAEDDRAILCVQIPRRDAQNLIRLASAIDERCTSIIHDIRTTDFGTRGAPKVSQRERSWRFLLEGLASFKRGIYGGK